MASRGALLAARCHDGTVILIDPPAWPAYGTTWSHLISDDSLEELHAFARRVGIPARGFDHDHYDVPADRYDALVAAGALPVSARQLLAALRDAGLRVPARDKAHLGPPRRMEELRRRWARVPHDLGLDVSGGAWQAAGEDLLARWNEPHRHYHDLAHLREVVLILDQLAHEGYDGGPTAVLAGWYHDAVYRGEPGADEEASAALACGTLSGLGVAHRMTERVGALIRATAAPSVPDETDAAVLGDADLAVLAGSPQRYKRYAAAVRKEYAHVPDEAFRDGRARVLAGLLALPALYHTPPGRQRWERRARENVARELDELRRG